MKLRGLIMLAIMTVLSVHNAWCNPILIPGCTTHTEQRNGCEIKIRTCYDFLGFPSVKIEYTGDCRATTPKPLPSCSLDMDYNSNQYDDSDIGKDIEAFATVEKNDEIWIAVVAQNVTNLDTYQAEVNFNPERLAFIGAYEDNSFAEITNLLKKNGGTTIGFQAVESSSGVVNIANSLVGSDKEKAPEGSGIIALLNFRVLDDFNDECVSLSNVHYLDSEENDVAVSSFKCSVINPSRSDTYGDINGDNCINMADSVLVLQTISGITPKAEIYMENEVDGNRKIDLRESLYVIQILSGIR